MKQNGYTVTVPKEAYMGKDKRTSTFHLPKICKFPFYIFYVDNSDVTKNKNGTYTINITEPIEIASDNGESTILYPKQIARCLIGAKGVDYLIA